MAPSRDESVAAPVVKGEESEILIADFDGHTIEGINPSSIQGGLERGLLLHKLIEEVLTGETQEKPPALTSRAEILVQSLNQPIGKEPSRGINPDELAATVVRALSLPEIAALRPRLLPELPVYAFDITTGWENVIFGIADAVALDASGKPHKIVDWKSDINPSAEVIEHYKAQVRSYLHMTDIKNGLIVLATPGTVINIVANDLPRPEVQ